MMFTMAGRQLRMFSDPRPRRLGRPPKQGRGVSHLRRPALAARFPVHVTMKVRRDVRNLRARECIRALGRAFREGHERGGFRMVGYSVQHNHIHFLVEGADAAALSRGMQGLNVRMARRLNRALGRSGKVFADRYHAHILRTPSEVASARNYVLRNHARHHEQLRGWMLPAHFSDRYARIADDAHTWLLREGWRRTRPRLRPPPLEFP